jgi:hypothetical protein
MEYKSGPQIGAVSNLKAIKREDIHTLLEEGELGCMLDWSIKDSTGKVIEKHSKKSESFVRQFLELLWIQAAGIPEVTGFASGIRDIGNTLRTGIHQSGYNFACNGGAGEVNFGIIVGTDNTAPTINDYVLGTPIAHGVGAGQLQYSAVTFAVPVADATTTQFTITRDFANGSGGPITVQEVALYVKGFDYNTTYYFMAIRDVIPGGIAVANGQTLTLNYRPQAVI